MATFYWIATSPQNAAIATNWSVAGPGGGAQGSWPGTSPDASDIFIFDGGAAGNCTWDIVAAGIIKVGTGSNGGPFQGQVDFTVNVALSGLELNGTITTSASRTLTFSTPDSSLNDSNSKKRFVRNHKLANPGTALTYAFTPSSADVTLDNGPYPNVSIATNPMVLAYNEPASATFDNADDGRIHIKGTFSAASTGGFVRGSTVPNAALDTDVKIKFDNTSFTYSASTLDFMLATAYFRGINLPVTGDTGNYGATTFTAKHYGVVVFASSAGDKVTMTPGLTLDCFSLVVAAGARLVSAANGDPAIIRTQTQPIVAGGWSFESMSAYEYSSPRGNVVRSVSGGGTGLNTIPDNALLIGNDQSDISTLSVGSNGQVLTVVAGSPAWAAASGGGGSGTVTSIATSAPITGGTITTTGTIGISAATTSAAGSMSSADKTKLDGIEPSADVTDTANVTAAGALMDSEVTNLAQVKAFDSADYATAAQGAKADSALQAEVDTLDTVANRGATTGASLTAAGFIMPGGTSAQKLTADGGFDATVYIPTGQYEAGVTPISAKGFIDTGTDTSWIAQSSGSRAVPSALSSGSSQVFSNGVNGLVTAWNQDLVTEQGITYSSGIWTIATAGVYEVYAKLGFLDGDASGSNTIGNPSSSSFIQTMTHILYSSDGTVPTASEILVRGPVYLQTNGTGISAKGSEARTVRRFDVGDKIAIGCFVRLQSNQSSSKKYRLRSGYYNECVIRRVG